MQPTEWWQGRLHLLQETPGLPRCSALGPAAGRAEACSPDSLGQRPEASPRPHHPLAMIIWALEACRWPWLWWGSHSGTQVERATQNATQPRQAGHKEAAPHPSLSLLSCGSSGSASAPTLFPLVSCENAPLDTNEVAVGCLAQDFLPDSITFSWKFKNNSDISKGVWGFPSVLRGGKYAATSQVLLASKDVMQGTDEHVVCKVQHPNGNKEQNVPLPGEGGPTHQGQRGSQRGREWRAPG